MYLNQHHTPGHTPGRRLVAGLFLGTLLVVGSQVRAQDSAASKDDEIIKLSTFTVTTDQDQGYRASNSIAGTRSNTRIKDIPLNIQVFTKDLVDDLTVTNQVDLERYNAALVNGASDVRSDNTIQQAYNNFLFRGFIQNWGLRDGIREYDPVDTQGLARVEIVKGPAAPLYGLTYPGGVMNSVTKEVDFKHSFGAIRLTEQSFGEYRAAVDANVTGKVALGDVGVRFNAANARSEDERAHSRGHVRYTQTNAAWRPLPTTELKLLIETGYREKPNNLGYFSTGEVDSTGKPLGNGADIPLQVTHPNIPWTWNWADGVNMRSLDTTLYRGTATQAIGNLVITGYAQYSSRTQIDSEGWDAAGGGGSAASWDMTFATLGAPVTGWINPNTPQEKIQLGYHHRDWCNSMHAYGATAVYKLDLDAIKNTFTVGANQWGEHFLTHKSIQPGTTTNLISFPVTAGIDTEHTPFAPPQDYYVDFAGAYGHEHNTNDYYFASWQGYLLKDRLKLNAAINHTNLKLVQWGSGTATTPNITEASKNSPMIGAMFDISREVSVFAVHSSSLFPTTDKNSFSRQMPPVVGKSNEAGVKIDLFDGKVSGTISYYEITQTGGSQFNPAAENLNTQTWDSMTDAQRKIAFPGKSKNDLLGDLVPGAEQQSKGVDVDLIVQPLPSWQILFSYAHNDEKVTKAIDATSLGQSTPGHIKDQWSALTKYSVLHGAAKGAFVGAGMQGAGQALQGYQSGIARFNPSTFYLEAFAGYRFKAFGLSQLIQLNAKNLTKQEDFAGWKATGSSSIIATERYRVPTDTRWSITYGIDL
jgi:outer membrane receptor protein involved in Fe transport